MPVEFAMPAAGRRVEGECAVYPNSLLFRTGEFEDKAFSMTPEELAAAIAAFQPVGGNIAHTEFLQGRACEVRSIRLDDADPTVLRGEVAVPLWLDEQLGDHERRLSCEWDRATKQLAGIALVTNPRIEQATLMAAFAEAHPAEAKRMGIPVHTVQWGPSSLARFRYGNITSNIPPETREEFLARMLGEWAEFAGRRHSTADLQTMQRIHDLAVEQGAECAAKMTANATPHGGGKETATMPTLWDRLKAHLGGVEDTDPPVGVTLPLPAATADFSAERAALTAERDAAKADAEKLRANFAKAVAHEGTRYATAAQKLGIPKGAAEATAATFAAAGDYDGLKALADETEQGVKARFGGGPSAHVAQATDGGDGADANPTIKFARQAAAKRREQANGRASQ